MPSRILWILALLFTTMTAGAQARPEIRKLLDATTAALNGTAEEFERYAQEWYAKELLAKWTSEERRAFLERLRGDFGKIDMPMVRRDSDARLQARISGTTGTTGALILDITPEAPHRITGVEIRIGEGEDEEALPAVPVRGSMTGEQLSSALDAYVRQLDFSGTVLIAKNGTAVFEQSYGLANRSDNVPNTPATRFSIGSINKAFTSAAIAQLAAAGKLSVDDPIGKHLPDHPNAEAKKATIAQLLDHTGGLGDFNGPEYQALSKSTLRANRDWYRFASTRPMTFAPGTSKRYCNNCYITLGEIVERVSGMPYETYIAKHVFEPAGMKTAGFLHTDAIEPHVAIGYTTAHGAIRSNLHLRGAAGSAAGSSYATAADLLAFEKWRRAQKGAEAGAGYAGGAEGVNAIVEADPTWVVVVLANMDPPAAERLGQAIHAALRRP